MADQKKMNATLMAPYFSSICQLSTTNSSMLERTCWKLVWIRMLDTHLLFAASLKGEGEAQAQKLGLPDGFGNNSLAGR